VSNRFSLALFFCALLVGSADAATTVLYPTGVYPLDVQNVQSALDGGGTVLLKATNAAGVATSFNFGPPQPGSGFVEFHVDAELIGERVAGAETIIDGGWYPVENFGDATTLSVRNITFNTPFDGALLLYGAHTEVTGNHAFHAIGHLAPDGMTTIAEVFVVGFAGRVLIEDNVIDDVVADLGFGVSQFRAAGPVKILRNTVGGTGYGTIESSFNISRVTGAPAVVTISDNVLRPGSAPNGFGVGIEINGEGAYYVARNDIVVESPFGIGVYAVGAPDFGIAPMVAPVIEKNHVVMRPTADGRPVFSDGIDLVGVVSRAYVGQNSIEGTSFSALGFYDLAPEITSDLGFNTYVGNNIATYDALVADVFLDTAAHDNVLKGLSGTVVDLGANNHISGVASSNQAATGQQVRDATRVRNDARQQAISALRAHGALP
jgi:hypothetical protein